MNIGAPAVEEHVPANQFPEVQPPDIKEDYNKFNVGRLNLWKLFSR